MEYIKTTPITRLFHKVCLLHEKEATYCSIEGRWICSNCEVHKELERNGSFKIVKWK